MMIGRSDDPEHPARITGAPDAADLFGAGSRTQSGPAACAAPTGRTQDRTAHRPSDLMQKGIIKVTNPTQDVECEPRDRPVHVEVTAAMLEAGAKVLTDVLEAAPYTAKLVARDVFCRMVEAGCLKSGTQGLSPRFPLS